MQVLQMSFIGRLAVQSTAEHSIGLIKQLFSPVLNMVPLDLGLPPNPGGVTEGLATLKEILGFMVDRAAIEAIEPTSGRAMYGSWKVALSAP
jgi:hypothetical protein